MGAIHGVRHEHVPAARTGSRLQRIVEVVQGDHRDGKRPSSSPPSRSRPFIAGFSVAELRFPAVRRHAAERARGDGAVQALRQAEGVHHVEAADRLPGEGRDTDTADGDGEDYVSALRVQGEHRQGPVQRAVGLHRGSGPVRILRENIYSTTSFLFSRLMEIVSQVPGLMTS